MHQKNTLGSMKSTIDLDKKISLDPTPQLLHNFQTGPKLQVETKSETDSESRAFLIQPPTQAQPFPSTPFPE